MSEVWARAAALAIAEAQRVFTKGLGALHQGTRDLIMMFFAPGWVPPSGVTAKPDEDVVRIRPETVLHYIRGIHYEHEVLEPCDWCTVGLDSQRTVQYSEEQTCDWKPPIVLADGPINQTIEQALAETADT